MWFGRLRFTTQLTILVTATTLISLLLVILLLLNRSEVIVENAIIARNIQLLQITARQLASPARDSDIVKAREVMAPIPQSGSIRRVALYSTTGLFLNEQRASNMPLADDGGDEAFAKQAIASGAVIEQRAPGVITLVAPVLDGERPVGALAIELPTDDIERELLNLTRTASLIALPIVLVMALVAWGIARYTARPIQMLTAAAAAFGRGDLSAPIDVRRGGELGQLAQEFRRMASDLQESRGRIETHNRELEQHVAQRTAELQQTLADLREAAGMQAALSAAIRGLSSPVVPVLEGIVVMPLIGTIDGERASLLLGSLLDAIEKHHASYAIIDVTGVPIIDTYVAKVLLQAAGSAKLLGTQAVLVGLRPELAQTIVGLGLDLSGLVTLTDLQSGVGYAIEQTRTKRK